MAEFSPSGMLYRPILNISPPQISRLREGYGHIARNLTPNIRNSLKLAGANELRLVLITSAEIKKAYRVMGVRLDHDDKAQESLSCYLEVELPHEFDEGLMVPTLPVRIDNLGQSKTKRAATIGGGDLVEDERLDVKAGIMDLCRNRLSLDDVWKNGHDEAAGAIIARSNHPQGEMALRSLQIALEDNPRLLPESIEYGKVLFK